MNCGIYLIKHIDSGNAYVGSSINITNRLKQHFSALKANKHHSPHLQNAWNLYGKENFISDILEFCNDSELLEKEQIYINKLGTYNQCKFASSSKRIYTIEERIRHSLKLKQVWKDGKLKGSPRKGINIGKRLKPMKEEQKENIKTGCLNSWKQGNRKQPVCSPASEEKKKQISESLKVFHKNNRHACCKLTDEQQKVILIDNRSNVAIGIEYGVHNSTISRIKTKGKLNANS